MGCKTQGYDFGLCSGSGINTGHCYYYTAPSGEGVTFNFVEYPPADLRTQGSVNVPTREENRVMYPSAATSYDPSQGTGAANCGKITLTDSCTTSYSRDDFSVSVIALDYYPNELSFDFGFSDTWFAYLYDTSNDAGVIGTPCFYIETRTSTTTSTTPASGVEGDPGYTPGSSSSSTSTTETCIPCTAFNCTPAQTTLRYTGSTDLTGDPDCPHPTLFGIGTDSNKLVFSYDQFSTQVPDGVLDFEASYDGVTYVDVWDEGNLQGVEYVSSQNPWGSGDESFSDFEIFNINDGVNAVDFIVKFRIEPIFDDTQTPTVFSGTRWVPTELLNAGTGFSVNDVYPIQFDVRLADNTTTTLTLNLRIKTVGDIESTQVVEGADILRAGDELNGHIITRAFHTSVGNFPYHIVYLDGNGSDFVKETQYTSDRDHVITAKAGYGIVDRAILIGMYEFLDKSVQFVTADVNRDAPDTLNTIKQPLAFISVSDDGRITDVNVSGGAYSFNYATFNIINTESALSGYSSGSNISTSGGSGSGLTVDIDVTKDYDETGALIVDTIATVKVHSCGSGYTAGDRITISGGSARIEISEITFGGENLDKVDGEPILTVNAPSDNDTGLSKSSTEEVNPKFILKDDPEAGIQFEVVSSSDGNPDIEVVSPTRGGDNRQAQIEGTVVGGVVTDVRIVDGGRGYTSENRPNMFIANVNDESTTTFDNAGQRDDLVPEFQTIVRSLPEGSTAGDKDVATNAIQDSYNRIPKSLDVKNIEPKLEIKLDPERERVNQRQQYKLSKDQTDPLRSLIVPDYDIEYLDDVDIPDDYKNIVKDDLERSKKTAIDNIDAITQEKIPDYRVGPESKVEAVVGSFTGLPTATQFTKYIMRQYRVDPTQSTTIGVTLSCSPVDSGCLHFTCNPPGATPGSSTTTNDVDEFGVETGGTTNVTNTYSVSPLLGEGCKSWSASGSLKIWQDYSRAAQTVVAAAQAFGNPFAD